MARSASYLFDRTMPSGLTGDFGATGSPYLFVVVHGERPQLGGSRYCLEQVDLVTIGRGEACTAKRRATSGVRHLGLQLPGNIISATHARLYRDVVGWLIEDAGSRNGTRINGRRVTRAELYDGDFIEIGRILLRFRSDLAGPSGGADDSDSSSSDLGPRLPGLQSLLPLLSERLGALALAARSAVSVLLTGEPGTGKRALARAIHSLSGRSGALLAVRSSELNEALTRHPLLAPDAAGTLTAGGTVLVTEVDRLSADAQALLLRQLQSGALARGGIRLLAAAQAHGVLDAKTACGDFDTTLHGLLTGYRYEVVPLRERREDLGLFIAALTTPEFVGDAELRLSTDAARLLAAYTWPLNIRELRRCLAAAAATAAGALIEPEHLPPPIGGALLG